MKFMKAISIISIMLFGSGVSLSAYGGPAAFGACILTCELACAGGLAITGGVALPAYLICAKTCPGNCAWAAALCFASDAVITVLENGQEVNKAIGAVKINDLVKTLHDDKLVWTRVLKNIKTEGVGEFIEVAVRNQNNNKTSSLKVTPNHVMLLVGEEKQTVDMARNLVLDDRLNGLNGDILVVTSVNKIEMQDEYTLDTEFGTVLASGVLTSAIYDKNIYGGDQLFNNATQEWKVAYANLLGQREKQLSGE